MYEIFSFNNIQKQQKSMLSSKPKTVLITHINTFLGYPSVLSLVNGVHSKEFSRIYVHDNSFSDENKRSLARNKMKDMLTSARISANASGNSDESAHAVVIRDFSEPPASTSSTGIVHEIITCTSTTPDALVRDIQEPIDVLINNDGYPAHKKEFTKISPETMREALEALTIFPFHLTSLVVKRMCDQRKGKVIFLTSATTSVGLPNYAPYVIGRGATNTMAITLAKEVAKYNVIVNAIAPNYVESETYFPKNLLSNPESYGKITANIPLKRLAKPEEAASLVAFVASDSSNFMTGQVIRFSGGW